jgi:hypothetical protein
METPRSIYKVIELLVDVVCRGHEGPDLQVRDAIRSVTRETASARPRVPLMERGLGNPTIAENVEEWLVKQK